MIMIMTSLHFTVMSFSSIRLLRVHWPDYRNLQICPSSAFIRLIKCWCKQQPEMCTLISEAFSNMACREDNSAWEMEKSPSRAFWARTLAICRSYSIYEEKDMSNRGHRSTASWLDPQQQHLGSVSSSSGETAREHWGGPFLLCEELWGGTEWSQSGITLVLNSPKTCPLPCCLLGFLPFSSSFGSEVQIPDGWGDRTFTCVMCYAIKTVKAWFFFYQ